jgi:glycine oxidase
MQKVDYIIVGLGLAGVAFTRVLEQNNKTFVVFEDQSRQSSIVAGGMYNPVILKRFTPVWDAEAQLNVALPFYKELEEFLGATYDYPIDTYRLFTSIEEQNNWFAKSDHPFLSKYLVPKIIVKSFKGIEAKFGYGKVLRTGRIDTKKLLNDYKLYLKRKDCLQETSFNYDLIEQLEEEIKYKSIKAGRVVFCEGFGIHKNPFFNYLPMNEAKGELITIHAPELEIDFVLKSSVFIMPLCDGLFKVGATFNWKDKTSIPTTEGRTELLDKLDKLIKVPYKIVEHVAGIRPTVKDRRPLVGTHPANAKIAILNGLGTRGVMIAPRVAVELFNHLEKGEPLRTEITIARFS